MYVAFRREAAAGFAVYAVNVRSTPGAVFKGATTALWRLGPSVMRERRDGAVVHAAFVLKFKGSGFIADYVKDGRG